MGNRKKESAELLKEARKNQYFAKLRNVPTSPRKMRLVADMVRGVEVFKALGILKFSNKEAARRVEKLLRSAIANWEQKNERKADQGELHNLRGLCSHAQASASRAPGPRLSYPQTL